MKTAVFRALDMLRETTLRPENRQWITVGVGCALRKYGKPIFSSLRAATRNCSQVAMILYGAYVVSPACLRAPKPLGSPSQVARSAGSAIEQSSNPVDLRPFYDKDDSFDSPGCWQAVPRGLQTLGNVPFKIAGLIQLWGEGPAGIGRNYRESVEGIPATGKFQAIYVLHGSSFTTAEGTSIAEVVFRYADGSSATNSILYGTDVRDWWQPLAEHNPLPTNSAS